MITDLTHLESATEQKKIRYIVTTKKYFSALQ